MKKEDKNKVLSNIFKYFLWALIIGFIALYTSQATGYFAYEQHKKAVFTEEQIKKFEKDVSDGKKIDINNYTKAVDRNYQTKASKLGLKLSEVIGTYGRKGVESIFRTLSRLVE